MSYRELAATIRELGISASFGIPGGGASLDLIDSLAGEDVPFHLCHFEGSAAIMAATFGRLTSTPGLSISIKGPGLANALPGMAVAWFEAFPLIHVAESTPAGAPAWVAHKRLPQSQLCSAITKSTGYLSADGKGFREAAKIAVSEVPAPVLLELGDGEVVSVPKISSLATNEINLSDMWNCIKQSRKPVVIAGAYAIRQGLEDKFAELQIPLFTTVAAKGFIDESGAYSAGIITGVDQELTIEWNLLPESDLVISVGISAREMLAVKPFSCPAIHLCNTATDGIQGFKFDWILGEENIPEVVASLRNKEWGADTISTWNRRTRDKLTENFLPGQALETIQQRFTEGARAVFDTGAFCTVGEHIWQTTKSNWFLASGQGRYMGTSLPMALGASLCDPKLPTVAIVGDGGIGMYLADIKIAVRHCLPLLIVLMSDGGFGSIRPRAREKGYAFTPIQSHGGSWVSVLEALGVPGQRVATRPDLERALSAWDHTAGPGFLEIAFNPDKYEIMTAGVRT